MNANPLTDMKMPVRRFADGGKVETTEELMARMSAKYGVSGKTSPTPQPAAPKPVVTALVQPASPSIAGAANVLKNRKQQIDEAAGYACGGKIKAHANGGKISGPGTPTSDSIPARVSETGEPIAVSNEERILSGAQDAFMEKLAQDLGFPDLDAMLEAGTGKPVGPTIKAGEKGAQNGMAPNPLTAYALGGTIDPNRDYSIPEEQQVAAKQAIASAPAYTPPAEKPIDSARNFRETDFSMAAADPKGFEAVRKAVAPTAPTAAQAAAAIRSPVATIQPGAQERTFSAVPTAVQSNPLLSDSYRPTTSPKQTSFTEIGTKESQGNPLTSINMNANNESLARANAISQSMIDGDGSGPKVTMLGNSALTDTQNLMDKWSREDGTAAAMNQAIANPKSAGAIASLASSQMANDTNRQSSADANALTQQGRQLAADVTKRGQDISAATAEANRQGNPLANELTKTQTAAIQSGLDDKKAGAAMLAEIQDPKTTPERRQALMQAYRLAQGKDPASKFIVVPGGEYTDPENPLVKMKEPSRIFNTETQQVVGAPQADAAVPPTDKRVVGQTYQTPKGPMIWRGTGWEAA